MRDAELKDLMVAQFAAGGAYFGSSQNAIPSAILEAAQLLDKNDLKVCAQNGASGKAEPVAGRLADEVADPALPLQRRIENLERIFKHDRGLTADLLSDAQRELTKDEMNNFRNVVEAYNRQ